jgi:hypothetical protein
MKRILVPLGAAVILAASGRIHGTMTDRWTHRADEQVREARARLREVPLQFGDWDGAPRRWNEFDKDATDEEYVTREYVHRKNGTAVGFLIAAGYSRNVWQWHIPPQCYPANGYKLEGSEGKTNLTVDGITAEFHYANYSLARGDMPVRVRIFWAFSGDGRWLAPDQPRLSFGRYRSLYKIYALRRLLRPDESIENDPCLDFLRVTIPRLNQSLFPLS